MTGLGGDELFGGYKRYLGLQLGERYAAHPVVPAQASSSRSCAGCRSVAQLERPRSIILKRFMACRGQSASARYPGFDGVAALVGPCRPLPACDAEGCRQRGNRSRDDGMLRSGVADTALERALRTDLRAIT